MRKTISTMVAAAGATLTAQAAMATPAPAPTPAPTIVSVNLFHVDSNGNCEDTIARSGCSPLGVTQAGGIANPLLNNMNDKTIALGSGSYYLFGNPFAGTSFMTPGQTISIFLRLSTGVLLIDTKVVPDLSVAGRILFDFSPYGITLSTTGITSADRMSFGNPPTAFKGDGNADFVLLLRSGVTAVPEPAAWGLLIGGMGFAGAALRRRKAGAQLA
ncbi:MAG: PEPxxWA-CTERM sorting domain-containing protein [Sphingomonas sp.]